MRKLLVTLVVLVALFVVVDRVAVRIAQSQIASRVQTSQGLPDRPAVHIGGFPFLTQVLRGRYSRVTATLPGITREGLTFSRIRINAEGVRVDPGDLVHGTVDSVPVDRADGEVLLSYDDLNAYLAQKVDVATLRTSRSGSGPDLRVTGSLEVPVIGRTVSLSGNGKIAVSGEDVTIRPNAVRAVSGLLPSFAQTSAIEALTIRFKVSGLPFGVKLDSATVTDDGLLFKASATGVTLSTNGVG